MYKWENYRHCSKKRPNTHIHTSQLQSKMTGASGSGRFAEPHLSADLLGACFGRDELDDHGLDVLVHDSVTFIDNGVWQGCADPVQDLLYFGLGAVGGENMFNHGENHLANGASRFFPFFLESKSFFTCGFLTHMKAVADHGFVHALQVVQELVGELVDGGSASVLESSRQLQANFLYGAINFTRSLVVDQIILKIADDHFTHHAR